MSFYKGLSSNHETNVVWGEYVQFVDDIFSLYPLSTLSHNKLNLKNKIVKSIGVVLVADKDHVNSKAQ